MSISKKPILITGVAGFIGSALAQKLIEDGLNIVGIDDLNNYYDVNLKKTRLKNIDKKAKYKNVNFNFEKVSIEIENDLNKAFKKYKPEIVINLAAQAGVRYSLENPQSYVKSNLVGFANILESCRNYGCKNFIYASSSSVYGGNTKIPYSELDSVNHPISLYAASKKSNELMAHSYSHLYGLPSIGLRLFTVYGPWGRPDMAPMIFARSIISNIPINVFNFGKMRRDFTYIDDVTEAIKICCHKKAQSDIAFDKNMPNPSTSFAPYKIFNVGNNKPINLMYFIELLEKYIGKKAIINYHPLQKGDVIETYANMGNIEKCLDFKTSTSLEKGLKKFADWFLDFYK